MTTAARKRVPIRRCAACGLAAPKHALLRIVRTTRGDVVPDPRGKASGRGAYLCESPACRETAIGRGRLDAVLRRPLSPPERASLQAAVDALPVGVTS